MKKTDRFQSLEEVRRERERLKGVRDTHQEALHEYWRLMHDHRFRRGLAGDAFGDMLRAWKPMRTIGRWFQSDSGAMGNILGVALGSRSRTFKGRLLAWAVSAIAPMLMKKYATPERMEHVATELKRSWDRIRERARQGA